MAFDFDRSKKISEKVMASSHEADLVTRLGNEMLEETEGPIKVTLEQFLPYVPLYRIDQKKIKSDTTYRDAIFALLDKAKRELGLTPYRILIVIESEENPREIFWSNRGLVKAHSDFVTGMSERENVPSVLPPTSKLTHGDLVLNSSLTDMVRANQTPEMIEYFQAAMAQSVILDKMFYEHNASPEAKARFDASKAPTVKSEASGEEIAPAPSSNWSLLDDD